MSAPSDGARADARKARAAAEVVAPDERIARVLSDWQIIGVRAEHDPSCNGDCRDRCPIPVQYELSTAEAATELAGVIADAKAEAWDEGWLSCSEYVSGPDISLPNPYRSESGR